MDERKGNLIVTRRLGEQLFIGDDIIITVLQTMGGKVRLSISAPLSMHIVRDDAINTEPKKAS